MLLILGSLVGIWSKTSFVQIETAKFDLDRSLTCKIDTYFMKGVSCTLTTRPSYPSIHIVRLNYINPTHLDLEDSIIAYAEINILNCRNSRLHCRNCNIWKIRTFCNPLSKRGCRQSCHLNQIIGQYSVIFKNII